MISIGSEIKIFLFSVIVISLFTASSVIKVWDDRSSTIAEGMSVHNYTNAKICRGYKECMYDICTVAEYKRDKQVVVTFPSEVPVCRPPSYIKMDIIIILFLVFSALTFSFAIIGFAAITVRDSQFIHRKKSPSRRVWRVLQAYLFSVGVIYSVQEVLGWCYHLTIYKTTTSLEVLRATLMTLSMLVGIGWNLYFFIKSIGHINSKLDRILGGLEEESLLDDE